MSTPSGKPFDVLIVGAGPAGSQLARLLAQQGACVGIIEKSKIPREKICGGGVTRKALDLLDADISAVVHQWITGAHLCHPNHPSVLKSVDRPAGCTVLRREFDLFLLDRARSAGARFFAETKFFGAAVSSRFVELQTSRGAFCCRLLIGADGIASTVRSNFFGRHLVRYVPALEALIPRGPEHEARFERQVLFDFGAMQRGYGWIFPKRDHLNVGVYSPYGGRRLRQQLAAFIARYSTLQPLSTIAYLGFPIPVRNVSRRFQANRVWLLGDAAGLADGLFGEGIYFALKSATLAAQALAQTEFSPNSTRYSELIKEELLPELRASEWMGKALFAFPSFAFSRLACNRSVSDTFAGLLSGSVGYRECLRKTVASAPRWLFARNRKLALATPLPPPAC